ncbi:MAG: hypothetical protein DVB31_16200 [Verrucomicrobia bacterium]|nr:MAG: hypothetical protein DVB31_16200 [Verrucomicrobiota bacterium]
MSKRVLGRGLESLLNGTRAARNADDPAQSSGVQLLLRGSDGDELVPPAPFSASDDTHRVFPSWALGVTLVCDAVLFLVAFWIVNSQAGWSRYVAAGALVMAGGAILSVAVLLRGKRAVQELQSLNPLAEEKPRLRVQFLDEQPRRRA